MKQISIMIKPASSLCNLRCKYCFYSDVSSQREVGTRGIMSLDTADSLIEHVFRDLAPGDHLNLAFQGGEPTLAGLDFFEHFAAQVNRIKGDISVSYALQTNGILLDEAWAAFLKKHRFLVGLSLDASAQFHNAARVDTMGNGTFKQVTSARKLLEHHQVPYNVLTVLTKKLARHPQAVWKFLQDNGISYVQFIPCLESMVADREDPFALDPESFAGFYTTLFRMWYSDIKKGKYTSVKLFDDIVNQLAFGLLTACGQDGRCRPQIVVEADGSVYPCDFYCLDRFCMGNLRTQSLGELMQAPKAGLFCRDVPQKCLLCQKCRYHGLCGGGCKRMRRAVFGGANGQKCGYQLFLNQCFDDLCRVAQMQKRLRGGMPPQI